MRLPTQPRRLRRVASAARRPTWALLIALLSYARGVDAAPSRVAGPPPVVVRPTDPGPLLRDWRAAEDAKTRAEGARLAAAEAEARSAGHARLAASYAAARQRLALRFAAPAVRGAARRPAVASASAAGTMLAPAASGPNLAAYIPPGWSDVLVPRNDTLSAGSAVIVPDSLQGGASLFFLNFGETNSGDAATPAFTDSLLLDNAALTTFGYGGWSAGTVTVQRNLTIMKAIGGGRHTLTMVRDAKRQVTESDETDNRSDVQYLWSPTSLTTNTPVSHAKPPARGTLAYPNCDGYRATQNWWGAIALTPANAGDDEDLALFTDYLDPINSFMDEAAFSGAGAGLSDAVIVNGNVAGQKSTVYPGVTWPGGSAGTYQIEATANDTTFLAAGHYGPFSFGANSLVRIYEVSLAPGDWNIRLKNSGAADLDFAIMPPDMAYMKKTDALFYASGNGAGQDESLFVHVGGTVAAYYGLLVLKHGSADIPATATYEFYIDNTPPVVSQLTCDKPSWTTTNQFAFSWTASDAETGVRYAAYSTNGAETQTQLSSVSGAFAYTHGANTFSVRAANTAGGSSAAQSVTFYFDGSAPATTVGALPATISVADSISLHWHASDLGSGATTYDIDYKHAPGGQWARWLTAITDTARVFGAAAPEPLQVGVTYAFRIRAHDLAGNVEAWPADDSYGDVSTTAILVDNSPPTLTSFSVSPQVWSNANWFTVSWAGLDSESGIAYYAYKTNGAETQTTATTMAGAFAYHEGQNTFTVRAVNGVGATSTSLTDTLYYDPTLPVSVVTQLPATTSDATPLVLNWSGFDATSGIGGYDVEYRIQPSGTWTAWLTATTQTSATFAPGSWSYNSVYAFRVRARDRAGNTEAWPADQNNGDTYTTVTQQTAAPPDERPPAPDAQPSWAPGVVAMLAAPSPSPARGVAQVRFAVREAGPVTVDVWSAGGWPVRTLFAGDAVAGSSVIRWDLRDAAGRDVPSGLYVVRCRAAGRTLSQRLTIAR